MTRPDITTISDESWNLWVNVTVILRSLNSFTDACSVAKIKLNVTAIKNNTKSMRVLPITIPRYTRTYL